jgi:hypothetical protein
VSRSPVGFSLTGSARYSGHRGSLDRDLGGCYAPTLFNLSIVVGEEV